MINNPLVSIVIPFYNDAQYIEQSVQSALNQSHPNIEVIVVDDGSNAETKAVLKKIEPKITKLITQENQGQSTARNVGIREAKGNYILVLDSDDYFEPTFCKKAIDVFLLSKNAKIVSCLAKLIYNNGFQNYYVPKGGDISNFKYSNCALGTSMFKKEDWILCNGYDEQMRIGYEDWEFFIRVLKNGGLAEIIQEPLYNYRKKTNSTSTIANQNKYNLLEYIYIKHKDLYLNDFDNFVKKILEQSAYLELQKLKQTRKIDYRLGNTILKPFRFLNMILKKIK